MSRGENIEKIFYQDVKSKKRTGTGAYHKKGKGSEKAGVAGGLRFPNYRFKKHQKNSKVELKQLHEHVLNIDEFNTLNDHFKIECLIEWRKRYGNEKIIKGMGIGRSKYNKLISQFNIEEIEESEESILSPEQMAKAKEKVIPYHEFKNLPDEQKLELIVHYTDEMGLKAKGLAKEWNKKSGTISTMKSNLRRKVDKQPKNEASVKDSSVKEEETVDKKENTVNSLKEEVDFFFNEGESETVDEMEVEEDNEEDLTEAIPEGLSSLAHTESKSDDGSFSIQLNGEYDGYVLSDKLQKFVALMNGTGQYKVSLNIEEVQSKKKDQYTNELLKKFTEFLKNIDQ